MTPFLLSNIPGEYALVELRAGTRGNSFRYVQDGGGVRPFKSVVDAEKALKSGGGIQFTGSVPPTRIQPLPGQAGKWAKGTYATPEEALMDHYVAHGQQVGAADVQQYLRKAENFANNLKGASKSSVPGGTPGVTRYRKGGKYIDIADADGTIISFGI
jgi:hypothetical protein